MTTDGNGTGPDEPEVIAVTLPCVVATLLPDGNIDVQLPNGPLPLNAMFTIAALVTRIANTALDDAAFRGRESVLEVARDLSQIREVKPS